jgi:hypothetical protein
MNFIYDLYMIYGKSSAEPSLGRWTSQKLRALSGIGQEGEQYE